MFSNCRVSGARHNSYNTCPSVARHSTVAHSSLIFHETIKFVSLSVRVIISPETLHKETRHNSAKGFRTKVFCLSRYLPTKGWHDRIVQLIDGCSDTYLYRETKYFSDSNWMTVHNKVITGNKHLRETGYFIIR